MEVTNLLNISTRSELYRWFMDNHDKVSDFWLRVNRANDEYSISLPDERAATGASKIWNVVAGSSDLAR